jgi:uncharacterized membrane protein YeiB
VQVITSDARLSKAVHWMGDAKLSYAEDSLICTLFRTGQPILVGIMKTTHLLATLVAATLPLAAIAAEDSSKTETTDQKQEQNPDMTGMKGMMGKGEMMSNWKDQDAELDKLVAEMNSASADKKLDAVAAVVTKLVEQRKAMHEQMQKMMSANEKDGMGMCRMMMGMDMSGDHSGEHSHHH